MAVCIALLVGKVFAGRLVYNNGTLTFEDDPTTPKSLSIESYLIGPFKIWHIGGIVILIIMGIIITLCCCKDVRIPRTRQEIEANHKLRQLHSKFEKHMFTVSESHYKQYLEQILSQKVHWQHSFSSNKIRTKEKLGATIGRNVGDDTAEAHVSKWKSVADSIKTITDEVPIGNTLMTGIKNNTGFHDQRPSQENIAKTLNAL